MIRDATFCETVAGAGAERWPIHILDTAWFDPVSPGQEVVYEWEMQLFLIVDAAGTVGEHYLHLTFQSEDGLFVEKHVYVDLLQVNHQVQVSWPIRSRVGGLCRCWAEIFLDEVLVKSLELRLAEIHPQTEEAGDN